MNAAVLVKQQGAVARHGNQDIPSALLLQLTRALHDLIIGFQHLSEDLSKLMVVGLDQEGMVLEDIDQKILGGIHGNRYAAAIESGHNALVCITGETVRYGTGQHQHIIRSDGIQFFV